MVGSELGGVERSGIQIYNKNRDNDGIRLIGIPLMERMAINTTYQYILLIPNGHQIIGTMIMWWLTQC